jgi:hypothetical protein
MKMLQEICGSNFWKEIGEGILRKQRDEIRRRKESKGLWCDKKES